MVAIGDDLIPRVAFATTKSSQPPGTSREAKKSEKRSKKQFRLTPPRDCCEALFADKTVESYVDQRESTSGRQEHRVVVKTIRSHFSRTAL